MPKHRPTCRCRACNNARHEKLVREIKVAVSKKFRRDAYVDDLTQYHGRTVRRTAGHETIGPWIDAGMSKGTFDLFVCAQGAVIWLDVKTGGGTLTPEQLQFQGWIRRAGGIAESVRSVEQAISIIEAAIARRAA